MMCNVVLFVMYILFEYHTRALFLCCFTRPRFLWHFCNGIHKYICKEREYILKLAGFGFLLLCGHSIGNKSTKIRVKNQSWERVHGGREKVVRGSVLKVPCHSG